MFGEKEEKIEKIEEAKEEKPKKKKAASKAKKLIACKNFHIENRNFKEGDEVKNLSDKAIAKLKDVDYVKEA